MEKSFQNAKQHLTARQGSHGVSWGEARLVSPINSHQGRRWLLVEGSLIWQTHNTIQVLEVQVRGVRAGNEDVSLQEEAVRLLQGALS